MSKNVFGENIEICSMEPVTGFFRNGNCDTNIEDVGMHTVCVKITDSFLEYSLSVGNDLSTPNPFYGFYGLREGDRWCLCLSRWLQAYEAGKAPLVYLRATHISALEFIDLDLLRQYAADNQV